MKIFHTFEKLLSYAFVRSKFKDSKTIPKFIRKCLKLLRKFFNPRILHIYAMSAFNVVSFLTFLSEQAETFQDYSETAYTLAMVIITTLGLIQFEVGIKKLFPLIDNIENLLKKRKC